METRLATQEALTERALKRIEHLENLFATSYPISTATNLHALTPNGRAFDSSLQSPPSCMVPLLQSSNLFNTVKVDDNCYDKYQDPPLLPDPVIPTDIFLPTPYYMILISHSITLPHHQGCPCHIILHLRVYLLLTVINHKLSLHKAYQFKEEDPKIPSSTIKS